MEKDIIKSKSEYIDHIKLEKSLKSSNEKSKTWPNAAAWGVVAGLSMGAYVLLLHYIGAGGSITLKFLKYLLLWAVLGVLFHKYRKLDASPSFFQRGISIGSLVTFVSAITFLLVNFFVTMAAPDLSFTKFGKEVNSIFDFMVTSGGIFFEILVFGLVGTFIWIEYLKRRADRDIDKK